MEGYALGRVFQGALPSWILVVVFQGAGCSAPEPSAGSAVQPNTPGDPSSGTSTGGASSAEGRNSPVVGGAGEVASGGAPVTEAPESPTLLENGGSMGNAGDGAGGTPGEGNAAGVPGAAPEWRVLSTDGGYSWFESPRALVHGTELLIGTVANGTTDASRRGDVELIVHDLATRETNVIELHDQLEADDHDTAALAVRPDGSVLAVYAKHDGENIIYYRISDPNTALAWGAENTFVPSLATRVTYSNLYRLSDEGNRVYDFYRGLDASFKPSYAFSDDSGASWQSGNVFIDVPSTVRHRPYVSYASNGTDAIHFLYTDGHPRDFDNGLHHMFYRGGILFRSDGTPIRALSDGLAAPGEGTTVLQGDGQNVPWTIEIKLDAAGLPHALYSVQVSSSGLPVGQGGNDIRYRMAHFDGQNWQDSELAFAGSRLYAGEDDYSGLAAFDPEDLFTVYLSTNSDPALGTPLISAADGRRHHELFIGVSTDRGSSWSFAPLTRNSTVDRLRPIVVQAPDGQKILIALSGTYSSYTSYQQQVIGLFFRGSLLDVLAGGSLPAPPR